MTEHDGSQLAEAEAALLRRLPARAHLIARRLRRFHAGGWDINGLCLLHMEAADLGAGCATLATAAADPLNRIAALAGGLVQREELPGLDTGEELLALAEALASCLPAPEIEAETTEIEYEAIALVVEEEAAPVASAPVEHAYVAPEPDADLWGEGAALYAPAPPTLEVRASAPQIGRAHV